MGVKFIGTAIVIMGCGGFGFYAAMHHRRKVRQLRQLLTILDFMHSELEYRRPPLPELCRLAGNGSLGSVGAVFERLACELDRQIAPDAGCCMAVVLSSLDIWSGLSELLRDLGETLGRFDLQGQIRGIDAVRRDTNRELDKLTVNQDGRLRAYQTLGLCAGAALAILLI